MSDQQNTEIDAGVIVLGVIFGAALICLNLWFLFAVI